jgi:hypothetical protein
MAKRATQRKRREPAAPTASQTRSRPSALLDTRIISACACSHADRYRGDGLDQLRRFAAGCVDRSFLWHRFPTGDSNSNRNYEVFWGDPAEPRASASGPPPAFKDRHASTQAYIEYMRPRCVELARVLKKTGSFYCHCDGHASHYVEVMMGEQHPACGPARARDSLIDANRHVPKSESAATEDAAHA